MSTGNSPLELLGSPGSPYTRKMLALLRYRRIPYAIRWGGHQDPPPGMPSPKVKLLPTFYFPNPDGVLEAVIDSTPIVRRLEQQHGNRSVIPDDRVLAFLDCLIEDYADEWLTKAMFHFRWAHEVDMAHAGQLLILWSRPSTEAEQTKSLAEGISRRQRDRLNLVGSNAITATTIEKSFERFVSALDSLITERGFVLGARPSAADFAIYGQLTQLAIVEPTPSTIIARLAPRVRAWTDRVEDLSGMAPVSSDWCTRMDACDALLPLLHEIGRVYAPFLLANAEAVKTGAASLETTIDGQPWVQPAFAYQAKCLDRIREEFTALSERDRADVRAMFAGTGCETLIV